MIAAIEIYNKPAFKYRDECFVILLLNAWELFSKALLSKNKKSIYYPKERNAPYRTLSLHDALIRAANLFPTDVSSNAILENVKLLADYRDNAVHFYNKRGFELIVYALAQTNVVNYSELLEKTFGIDLAQEITIRLLPIGLTPPIDPLTFLQQPSDNQDKVTRAVAEFIHAIKSAIKRIEQEGGDITRVLTIFKFKLESTKKLEQADLTVPVVNVAGSGEPLLVTRRIDPNESHPLIAKRVIEKVETLHGRKVTSYVLQAIVWKYDVRKNMRYCWRDSDDRVTRYSHDFVAWLKSVNAVDMNTALVEYRQHLRILQGRTGQTKTMRQGPESV